MDQRARLVRDICRTAGLAWDVATAEALMTCATDIIRHFVGSAPEVEPATGTCGKADPRGWCVASAGHTGRCVVSPRRT